MRDCKRAERYATQPFGAGDAEDIALETEVRWAYRLFFTKSLIGDIAAPRRNRAPSRRRAGVASMSRSARREILISTQDYFKCFLLQGAVYRGLDAIDPIIDVDEL